MIHVSYQISEKEFKRSVRGLWISNRIWIYAAIACVFLVANLTMSDIEGQYKIVALSWMLPLVLIVVLFLVIYSFSLSRAYKQTPLSKGELKYTFSEEDIEYDAPDSSGNLKWSALKKIKETKEFFYLYTTNVTAIIIPKRAFNIESDLNAFRSLVVSKNLLKR
jgi:hypothetical protein